MSCLQLVADAGSVVMMTNAEKQRLQQLLEEEHDDDNDEVFFMCVDFPQGLPYPGGWL